MKTISTYLAVAAAAFTLAACGAPAGNTANSNSARTANSNSNTAGNAANNVSNAVSNSAPTALRDTPDGFLMTAAQGGMSEVEMGKVAAAKATDPEIKKFAQTMVEDHGAANEELKALAAKKNLTLPTDLGPHQPDLEELKRLSGAEFDRAYVKLMYNDHERDVEEFQGQADESPDPDVKAFAAKTLPTLKKHLESIKTISARVLK